MRWGSFLARLAVTAAVLSAVIFAAVRVAVARPGAPGGAARSFVTIAGTVTGVPAGMTLMRFTFRRQVAGDAGLVEVACERMATADVAMTGEFAVEVPLEPFTTQCPATMFDGRDVSVDVAVNGVPVVDGGAVNPVPYALHASIASAAAPDSGLERQLATAAAGVPPGTVVAYAGAAAPPGWALCDGRAVSRGGEYEALFRAIGASYGAGDTVTTFNLPDLRGRVIVGAGSGPSLTPRALGEQLGEERHTLTVAELAPHSHLVELVWPGSGGCASIGNGGPCSGAGRPGTQAAGAGAPHNVMQPSLVANHIIKL
ncbi:MAG: tail fiber protein [Polyangiales bacterium]